MPNFGLKPQNVNRHGTMDQQQIRVEEYKIVSKYKELKIKNDALSTKIKKIYDDNYWNLKEDFVELRDHLKEIGNSGAIAWDNDIQYLDITRGKKALVNISLDDFKSGKYYNLYTGKKTNSKETEQVYANRISFFTRTFPSLKKYDNIDNLSWIVKENRQLFYEILKYHNTNKHSLSTLNKDLKVMVRILKLLMKEEHELRYKFSALQIAITDLENISDDLNKIKTRQEMRNFIPYEQILEKCDELEKDYYDLLNDSKYDGIREDGKRHHPDLFYKHMLLLAVAMNTWDYPSRNEKYKMDIIKKTQEIKTGKNYVLIPDGKTDVVKNDCNVTLVFNEVVKKHKPIRYTLNSSGINQLNIRLCNLIKYSFKVYPRPHLFVNRDCFKTGKMNKLSVGTISSWLSEIYKNKNLGIDTFRSAFVSYYFPKFNNRQRQLMRVRMRTSIEIMMRSYLKIIYQDPVALAQVKISPDQELLDRANVGVLDPIIVGDLHVIEEEDEDQQQNEDDEANEGVQVNNNENDNQENVLNVYEDIGEENPVYNNLIERKRHNFKTWYQKEDNRNKKRDQLKSPLTYAKRYVRELNEGIISYDKLQQKTIDKYKLKIHGDKYVTELV
jgi:hypothetical protein